MTVTLDDDKAIMIIVKRRVHEGAGVKQQRSSPLKNMTKKKSTAMRCYCMRHDRRAKRDKGRARPRSEQGL